MEWVYLFSLNNSNTIIYLNLVFNPNILEINLKK